MGGQGWRDLVNDGDSTRLSSVTMPLWLCHRRKESRSPALKFQT